jgi:hypothetical protein
VQVRSTSIALPSTADYRRHPGGAAAARAPGDAGDEAPRREVTRIRASAPEHGALGDVPARSRGALSAYLSNGPSLSERYGVELAGIDLFV